ncbi:MAG: hypothetical protein IJ088_00440 [Clostridia bacterium]|nr:hypothetical protein [Clostridia bacterium]
MLSEKDPPIPIPENGPAGRSFQSKGYVYWVTKSKWNSEKKRSEDDRVLIGRVAEEFSENGKTMMWPNKKYKQRFAHLPGTKKITHCSTMAFGVYLFALKAAEQTGVLQAIKAAFPVHWAKVFAICVQWIDRASDVSQIFETWHYDNFCGFYTALDPSAFTDFYKSICQTDCPETTYRKVFRKEYAERFLGKDRKRKCICGCDSTNENHETKSNELTGFGHAKTDSSRPIFNRMSFVDEETGMTLYMDMFPGPVLDKSEIPYTMEKVADLGFELLHCIFDRGFISKDMALQFQDLKKKYGIEFSAMLPSTYALTEEYIRDHMYILFNEEYYIPEENIYGIHIEEEPVFLKDNEKVEDLDPKNLFDVYVFYDDLRAAREREDVNDKVQAIERAILERKEYTVNLVKLAEPYFHITPCLKDPVTGRNFKYKRNKAVIQSEKEMKGYFLVVGNGNFSASDEIIFIRRRDKSEKSYKRRKSFLGLLTPCTETDDTFKGKMLIGDIAQNVFESIEYYSQPFLKRKRSETVETLIAKLRRYKIFFKEDGTAMPDHAMRSDEKEIFSCLDLSSDVIESYMRTIRWGDEPGMIKNDSEIAKEKEEQAAKAKEEKKAAKLAEKERQKAERKAAREAEREKKANERKAMRELERIKKKAEREANRNAQKASVDADKKAAESDASNGV